MNVQYDQKRDVMYIDMADGVYDRSKKISDAIIVDVAKDGSILGIEILDTTENIKYFDPKNLSINLQFAQ
ncbi:MAG: DUF2283 domain-containing protein [Candidatus Roizmanbacteria bacterium]|nr:DUF2283 domain-containing protein [Candidatus Roizmanbacteria bacterium]